MSPESISDVTSNELLLSEVARGDQIIFETIHQSTYTIDVLSVEADQENTAKVMVQLNRESSHEPRRLGDKTSSMSEDDVFELVGSEWAAWEINGEVLLSAAFSPASIKIGMRVILKDTKSSRMISTSPVYSFTHLQSNNLN